ncbi:hypothetical protein Q3G72_018591 [Acer saccharum]|nr:hypothetical protein Q3G72_018591 [Acer saccharum]
MNNGVERIHRSVEDHEDEEDSEEGDEDDDDDDEDSDSDSDDCDKEDDEGEYEEEENESMTMTLTDPQALNCLICYNPLTAPIFQCGNGHIACPSCIPKLKNKCPFCRSPIGSSRCWAIERVLESIKLTCRNTKYGCKATMSYSNKCVHEKTCIYTPCSCPISACQFVDSHDQLNKHFSESHKISPIKFQFNKYTNITLGINDKFLILQEEMCGVLLILNNSTETSLGNIISVSCIGPTWRGGYIYDIQVKPKGRSLSLRFHGYTKCIKKQAEKASSTGFCLVLSDSLRHSHSSGQLKLDLRISRCSKSHELNQLTIE